MRAESDAQRCGVGGGGIMYIVFGGGLEDGDGVSFCDATWPAVV